MKRETVFNKESLLNWLLEVGDVSSKIFFGVIMCYFKCKY